MPNKDPQKRKEYNRKYRQKNKEKVSEAQKQWVEKNREKSLAYHREYNKDWYQKNKEEHDARGKEWSKNNIRRRREIGRKYAKNNPDKMKVFFQNYAKSIEGKYRLLKYRAKHFSGTPLTLEEFASLMSKSCVYCGEGGNLGIDRIENSKGYTKENSAPCCKMCNYMKKNYTLQDFLAHVKKIANFNK